MSALFAEYQRRAGVQGITEGGQRSGGDGDAGLKPLSFLEGKR